MPLQVHTARISTRDPDRLDVTRKSGKGGLFLAPSWSILGPVKLALKSEAPIADVWAFYRECYLREMRHSYATERSLWDALLARERVVLTCFCTDPIHCHRFILRTRILPKLGAVDCGELPSLAVPDAQRVLFAGD
jgi:hypothetical protein